MARSTFYRFITAVIFVFAVTDAAVSPAEARKAADRAVNLAAQQEFLVLKMATDTMLIALGIDAQPNLKNLEVSRKLFIRTLRGLHAGDEELGLPGTSHPTILTRLASVEEIWRNFDSPIQQALESGSVSDEQVQAIAQIGPDLAAATDEAAQAYVEFALGGQSFSMQTAAIRIAGRQRMLSQKILKEALLVTYGYDAARNRSSLMESFGLYDRVLNGLLEGDAELRLAPAPSAEIVGQLEKAQRLWGRLLPLMQSVAGSTQMDATIIRQGGRLAAHLDKTMTTAVLMYENM